MATYVCTRLHTAEDVTSQPTGTNVANQEKQDRLLDPRMMMMMFLFRARCVPAVMGLFPVESYGYWRRRPQGLRGVYCRAGDAKQSTGESSRHYECVVSNDLYPTVLGATKLSNSRSRPAEAWWPVSSISCPI